MFNPFARVTRQWRLPRITALSWEQPESRLRGHAHKKLLPPPWHPPVRIDTLQRLAERSQGRDILRKTPDPLWETVGNSHVRSTTPKRSLYAWLERART